MTTAIIENGIVTNVIVGQIEGSIEIPDGFGIGDLYDNGVFTKAPIVLPEPLPIQVPTQLTPRQARLALLNAGLLDEVETLLANDRAMQIWWEYSLDIQRNHEHTVTIGGALRLTETQLDELFTEGAKL